VPNLEPGGYTIGINVGAVAGQTVVHVHAHLIPRYAGNVPDPVGGVRNIIPGRSVFWDRTTPLSCSEQALAEAQCGYACLTRRQGEQPPPSFPCDLRGVIRAFVGAHRITCWDG
jgi:hypothetical protein